MVQTALDVVGLIPGLGEVADGVNAAIYLARGDYANAALSAASCIPFAGMASTGAKFAGKASKAAKATNKLGNAASVAKKTMSTLKKGIGEAAEGLAGAIYTTAKTAKKTAVNVAGKVQSTVSSVKKSVSDGWNKLKSAFGSKGSTKNADVKTNGATDAAKGGKTSGSYANLQDSKSVGEGKNLLQRRKRTLFSRTWNGMVVLSNQIYQEKYWYLQLKVKRVLRLIL